MRPPLLGLHETPTQACLPRAVSNASCAHMEQVWSLTVRCPVCPQCTAARSSCLILALCLQSLYRLGLDVYFFLSVPRRVTWWGGKRWDTNWFWHVRQVNNSDHLSFYVLEVTQCSKVLKHAAMTNPMPFEVISTWTFSMISNAKYV